jgi:hypothetical protein
MTDKPSVNYDDPLAGAEDVTQDDINRISDEIVTAIQRPKQGDPAESGSDGYMNPHALPSFGETDDDCGEPMPFFCCGCGDHFTKAHRCKRSRCPEDSPLWAVDRAENDVARLQTVCRVMSSEMGESVKKHHLTFMPPSDWFLQADDPVRKTREVVAEILKILNAEGVVYYHGWSGIESDDRGDWKNWVMNGREWDDVRSELKPRPHFHALAASPFVIGGEVTKRVEEETGWVIERIADDETGRSLKDLTAAAFASTYSLSHLSIHLGYCSNGDNRAIKAGFGKFWNSVNVRSPTRREAERAVRTAAPRTLGVSPSDLRCKSEIPISERHDRVEEADAYDDVDADASAESDADASSSDADCEDGEEPADDVQTVECKAPIKPLTEAEEFLEDDEWVKNAIHSESLKRRYQDFQAQSMLDNPPPMVAALT